MEPRPDEVMAAGGQQGDQLPAPAGRPAPVLRPSCAAATEARRRGELASRMVAAACELALLVRDAGREEIGAFLAARTEEEIRALLVVLAAMVPVDEKSAADLLSWVTWDESGQPLKPASLRRSWGRERVQPCGTPAAYRRHLRHGEEPDEACKAAVREVWAERHRNRRRSGRGRDDAAA